MSIKHKIYSYLFLLTILLINSPVVFSQQNYYSTHLSKGKDYFSQDPPEYVKALKEFDLAKNYIAPNDTTKQAEIERWNERTRQAISDLFENMKAAQRRADIEMNVALEQKEIADSLKNKAEESLALANKIIDAFYFYDEKFALAYKNNRYGFINKEGDPVIGYKYEEARPFDYTSLARVKRNNRFYLLDSTNTEYLLSDGINNVRRARAFDLSNMQLTEFPDVVFQPTRLKILLLNGNFIKSIPSSIAGLNELMLLNLSKNNLEYLPKDIYLLSNLKELLVYDNKLIELPIGFDSLNQLKILDAGNNQLEKLPDGFGQIDSLHTLVLYDNLFTEFDDEIFKIKGLRKLDLSGNMIANVPEEISKLSSLTNLHLWNNKIDKLPDSFTQLNRLTELVLGQNKLSRIDTALYSLSGLTVLDLSYNRIDSIPAGIDSLQNLSFLFLNANRISTFPAELTGLNKLRVLNLSLNQLTTIPSDIDSLSSLTSLNLSYNLLENLPELTRLSSLKTLDISYNRLKILPSGLDSLINLEEIIVRKNQLSSLPPGLVNLPGLKYLDLRDNSNLTLLAIGKTLNKSNKDIIISANATDISYLAGNDVLVVKIDTLTEIPESKTLLKNLSLLDIKGSKGISAGQIRDRYASSSKKISYTSTDFPTARSKDHLTINLDMVLLIALDTVQSKGFIELDISASNLSELPVEVKSLTKLTRLDASDNQLKILSTDIGKLVNLRTLVLDNNLLRELPEEIKYLTKLTTLYLRNNPIDEENKERISEWLPQRRVIYTDELVKQKTQ